MKVSPKPNHAIQNRRWPVLLIPAFTGILFLFFCFWTLDSAHASGEPVNMAKDPETNYLPPYQTSQGSNRFAEHFESSSVRHTWSMAWADMDGDGDLDLAVGNGQFGSKAANSVNQIYVNGGDGRFTIEADIGTAADNSRAVAWGDWDGDGDLDLAVANYGQPNLVYENVAAQLMLDPEIDLGWTASMTSSSTSLAWGDWDSDGDLDLAIGNDGAPNQVYQNISGTLQLSWESPLSDALQTRGVAWADWDGDGDLDLTFANYQGVDQIYENISDTFKLDPVKDLGWQSQAVDGLQAEQKGCSPFQYWGATVNSRFATSTRGLSWGDWDNDGDLDLATGGGSDDGGCGAFINVYENISGTLQLGDGNGWQMADATSAFKPSSIAWGDWDGDGDLDLVVGNNAGAGQGKENRVYENSDGELRLAPGRYGWQSTIEPSLNAETSFAIALGDADGDGDLDLAVGNGGRENGGQTNLVLLNTSSIAALDPEPWQSHDAKTSMSTAWGDWDADGDLDLAVGNAGQANQVYENVAGKLQFDPQNDLGWESTVVTDDMTTSVAWGDWNGDGNLDLAVGNNGQPDYVYVNQGETLSLTLTGEIGWVSNNISSTQSLAWGDWDRDGDLDLAAGHCGRNGEDLNREAAVIYENEDGTLQFDPEQGLGWQSPGVLCTRSVGWGDWDNDGDLDLALGARVYENVAGNLFLNERENLGWNGNIDANSVAWGDMDGDGDLDLAVGTSRQNRVYENLGGYLYFSPLSGRGWQSYAFDIKETTSVAWGDVDGDEDLDLAVANGAVTGFETNQIFENTGKTLTRNAVWRSPDPRFQADGQLLTSHSVAWGDVDNDGDLDLATANACTSSSCKGQSRPNHLFENSLQGSITTASSNLTLSIDEPYEAASANFYASPEVLASSSISLPYVLRDPLESPVGRIEVQFSLDGGDNWEQARPLTGTQTTNLETSASGTAHIFNWDTFGSDFFGRSDNVVIRMTAFTTPPAGNEIISGTYRYVNGVAGSFQRPFVTATSFPFRAQSTQIKVVDEQGHPIQGAFVFRLPKDQVSGAQLMPAQDRPVSTDEQGLLPGGGELQSGDELIALQPVSVTDRISFTDNVSLYYTSAQPSNQGLDMFKFEKPGIVTLIVSEDNPLLLFDIDIALEWDARNDESFLIELEDGIKRASELLYDVTNGQAALGNVRVFQGKEGWSDADAIVSANNGLRPSAAIGGITQVPLSETVRVGLTGTKTISNAYAGGQIRMGTVWDPFGENNADLGPDWWQTLAHELAHYLLFLPDDYLGFKDEIALGTINCQGSFMTSSFDPEYSELLTESAWLGECQDSLAERTTGRNDWETVRAFYPVLNEPDGILAGPNNLPLEVTSVLFYDPLGSRSALRARNFVVRDEKNERLRLPSAQAYLFQTQGTDDLSDDVLVRLGTPTGGGDRLKIRGAYDGDRLCLFDRSGAQGFTGCDDYLRSSDVSIRISEVENNWQPKIDVRPLTTRTLQITVTQQITDNSPINVQVFPAHYWSEPGFTGLAPAMAMSSTNGVHTQTLALRLPAYDISIRVWVDGDHSRETIDQFRLNLPWEPENVGGGDRTGHRSAAIDKVSAAAIDKVSAAATDRASAAATDRALAAATDRASAAVTDRASVAVTDRASVAVTDRASVVHSP